MLPTPQRPPRNGSLFAYSESTKLLRSRIQRFNPEQKVNVSIRGTKEVVNQYGYPQYAKLTPAQQQLIRCMLHDKTLDPKDFAEIAQEPLLIMCVAYWHPQQLVEIARVSSHPVFIAYLAARLGCVDALEIVRTHLLEENDDVIYRSCYRGYVNEPESHPIFDAVKFNQWQCVERLLQGNPELLFIVYEDINGTSDYSLAAYAVMTRRWKLLSNLLDYERILRLQHPSLASKPWLVNLDRTNFTDDCYTPLDVLFLDPSRKLNVHDLDGLLMLSQQEPIDFFHGCSDDAERVSKIKAFMEVCRDEKYYPMLKKVLDDYLDKIPEDEREDYAEDLYHIAYDAAHPYVMEYILLRNSLNQGNAEGLVLTLNVLVEDTYEQYHAGELELMTNDFIRLPVLLRLYTPALGGVCIRQFQQFMNPLLQEIYDKLIDNYLRGDSEGIHQWLPVFIAGLSCLDAEALNKFQLNKLVIHMVQQFIRHCYEGQYGTADKEFFPLKAIVDFLKSKGLHQETLLAMAKQLQASYSNTMVQARRNFGLQSIKAAEMAIPDCNTQAPKSFAEHDYHRARLYADVFNVFGVDHEISSGVLNAMKAHSDISRQLADPKGRHDKLQAEKQHAILQSAAQSRRRRTAGF